MSGSAQRMREILNATGAYRLTGQSMIDSEINACAVAIDSFEDEMQAFLNNIFAATADKATLDRLEKLYRTQASSAELDDRREFVKARLAVNPTHFTTKYLPDMLKAANILGEAFEDNGKIRVLFGRAVGISPQWAKSELKELLPAHIEIVWDEAVNWATLTACINSFAHADSLALTWEQIDALTREELENTAEEE